MTIGNTWKITFNNIAEGIAEITYTSDTVIISAWNIYIDANNVKSHKQVNEDKYKHRLNNFWNKYCKGKG